MIGFPAAFLEHGASTVLATLWPVEDLAAALLVGRFYREWRAPAAPTAAQALRAAQNWLRDATSDSLSDSLTDLVGAPEPVGGLVSDARNRFYAMDPDERPFAHPQHWAAFMISGL
jgi:CHAT domain-containing protein